MSQYGATKVAAESLIAQINSHCKLATKNDILRTNKHALEGVAT
jgi:hypothetical protein